MKKQFSGSVTYIDHDGVATVEMVDGETEELLISLDRLPDGTLEGDCLKFIITQDPEMMRELQKDDLEGGFIKKGPITKFRDNA